MLRLITIVLIVYQVCQITEAAASIKQEARNSKLNGDKVAQASDHMGYHPYGNSFDAIHSRPEISTETILLGDPMGTAASHHHKKSTKGWLDMGAWTKKKGAFGWYADYPVGKGK